MSLIPEQQLSTWANPPSKTEMQRIINAGNFVKNIINKRLPVDQIKYSYNLSYFKLEIYSQGSYANSTNVRFDSDIDIVVQLSDPFFPNKTGLTTDERALYELSYTNSMYKFDNFKADVFKALKDELTDKQVHWNDKCFVIDENDYRIKADVIPCFQYRLYKKFISYTDQIFIEGIKFFDTSNSSEIINYPKIHLKNCEAKNTDTGGKFKDLIRIFKNMRNNLIDKKIIEKNLAPSYYIENLLYNCSSPCFKGGFVICMLESFQFIFDAIESGRISGFICANEQDNLITIDTWNKENLIKFMQIMANYFLGKITL